jgi:nicotinic acetylcholine receptor
MSLRLTIENIAQELKDELEHSASDGTTDTLSTTAERLDHCSYHGHSPGDSRRRQYHQRNNHPRTNTEILEALKRLVDKQDREEQEDEVMQEWREVAQKVDRILFWVFLTGTLGSTILILVIAPAMKIL